MAYGMLERFPWRGVTRTQAVLSVKTVKQIWESGKRTPGQPAGVFFEDFQYRAEPVFINRFAR